MLVLSDELDCPTAALRDRSIMLQRKQRKRDSTSGDIWRHLWSSCFYLFRFIYTFIFSILFSAELWNFILKGAIKIKYFLCSLFIASLAHSTLLSDWLLHTWTRPELLSGLSFNSNRVMMITHLYTCYYLSQCVCDTHTYRILDVQVVLTLQITVRVSSHYHHSRWLTGAPWQRCLWRDTHTHRHTQQDTPCAVYPLSSESDGLRSVVKDYVKD